MITGMAVYLAVGPADLRGAFDRLAALTRHVLSMEPDSGALFLFVNRRRNRLKALWWDRNGYAILYKRLARGTFPIACAATKDAAYVQLSTEDFSRLLAGLPLQAVAPATRQLH